MSRQSIIIAALETMGCRHIRQSGSSKIISTCPNESQHTKGYDRRPSYAVMFDDSDDSRPPMSSCFTCKIKEPFTTTIIRYQFENWIPMGIFLLELLAYETVIDDMDLIHENLSRANAVNFDAPGLGVVNNKWKITSRAKPVRSFYELFSIADISYDVIPESAYEPFKHSIPQYALTRGLTIETCREWELGHDRKRARLLFPVRNHRQQLVGISGRLYDPTLPCWKHKLPSIEDVRSGRMKCPVCDYYVPPKYLHSENQSAVGWRNAVLYGESKINLDVRAGVLCEGNIDVIKLWQAGVINPLAALGSWVSPVQIAKMRTWFDELWLWGDNDDAGDKMEEHVKNEFTIAGGIVHKLSVKPAGDPGDLESTTIREALTGSGFNHFRSN